MQTHRMLCDVRIFQIYLLLAYASATVRSRRHRNLERLLNFRNFHSLPAIGTARTWLRTLWWPNLAMEADRSVRFVD
jgi:hypothetical protein